MYVHILLFPSLPSTGLPDQGGRPAGDSAGTGRDEDRSKINSLSAKGILFLCPYKIERRKKRTLSDLYLY